MPKSACYFDGFNLYHAIDNLGKPHLKWLNLRQLAQSLLTPEDDLWKVVYFSAIQLYQNDKSKRHKRYIDALRSTGVVPVLSKFQNSTKYCHKNEQYCEFKEEKQTDVAFAVNILTDAMNGAIEKAVLITADSDYVPLVQMLLEKFPHIELVLAAPPKRLKQARELGALIQNRVEISEGRLATCLLPRTVLDNRGKTAATCPADYARPWEKGWH